MARPFQRFCKNGHDTFAPGGRYDSGGCRLCVLAHVAKYRAANPEKARSTRLKSLRKYHGVVDATGEMRSGPCEICGRETKKLHLDHDHKTGRIRGWLCPKCNTRLECFENEEWRKSAEQYLQKAKDSSGT